MDFLLSIIPILIIIFIIFSIFLVIRLLQNKNTDENSKLKWELIIMFIPVVGPILYLMKK